MLGLGSSFVAVATPPSLARGVNVLSDDPVWNDPAKTHFPLSQFARIRGGGFDTVRINLKAFAHIDSDGHLDPIWLSTLDREVTAATQAGLNVIVDEHDYRACGSDPDVCRTKLLAFWQQIALHYQNAPATVLFEILNEPNNALTPERWNSLLAEALAVIRKTNPSREVIVGPGRFNSFRALNDLKLPEDDRHLIVTVHYYDPFHFTHQGAAWVTPSLADATGVEWGSAADRAKMDSDIGTIAAWGRNHQRPMFIGEFGTYDKANIDSRVAWTRHLARDAEAKGIAWCYWDFDAGFGVFDRKQDEWNVPIHGALVPDFAAR